MITNIKGGSGLQYKKVAIFIIAVFLSIHHLQTVHASEVTIKYVEYHANRFNGEKFKQLFSFSETSPAMIFYSLLDIDDPNLQFSNPGYVFESWNTNYDGSGKAYNPGASITMMKAYPDVTVYAQWKGLTYKAYLDTNEGNGTNPSYLYVKMGERYGTLQEPQRDGYTFLGWFTASIGGTKVTSVTRVNTPSNHTLYAHWEKNVKITFDSNGGDAPVPPGKTVPLGSPYGELPFTSRQGYIFDGWWLED